MTVACAYIVWKLRIAPMDAIFLVKRARPCARPNDGFITFWLDKIVDTKVSNTQARDLPHVEEARQQHIEAFVRDLEILAMYDPIVHDDDGA